MLAKIFGCFKIVLRKAGKGKDKSSRKFQMNLLVMENLFYGREVLENVRTFLASHCELLLTEVIEDLRLEGCNKTQTCAGFRSSKRSSFGRKSSRK